MFVHPSFFVFAVFLILSLVLSRFYFCVLLNLMATLTVRILINSLTQLLFLNDCIKFYLFPFDKAAYGSILLLQ